MNRVWLSFLILLLGVATLEGQVVTGAISGRVTDATGAVLPGVSVEVRNTETGFSRSVEADASGRYLVRNLPLGSYSVTVQHPGFRTEVRGGITLTVGSEVVVNMGLSVGTVEERVEVVGEAPAIETTTATLSGLVNSVQMRDLPLNGRSYEQLALLSPGVVTSQAAQRNASQGSGLRLAINGARADMNLYLLDGTVVNDASSHGPGSAAGVNLGVEAIREFRVLSHNFSAEYGRNAGAVVSTVTRSGTNEFHGSAYEFLRNNVLDARNFFDRGELPPFRRNQFGGSMGGPILRDRIFFFANYEGLRQRKLAPLLGTVPDVNARQGLVQDPVTGQLREVPFNPIIKPYLNLYPLPNGRSFGDGTAEFSRDSSLPVTENYAMERMDFRFSDQDSFYWRYVFNPSESGLEELNPAFGRITEGTNHFAAWSETHIFSGTSLNEFRFAFNRTVPAFLPRFGPDAPDRSLSFLPGAQFGTISFTTGQGGGSVARQLSEAGSSRVVPGIFPQNVFEVTDSFSTVRGAHTLKFGFDLERIQLNPNLGTENRGVFTFGGLLDLLAGRPSQFRAQVVGPDGNPVRGWRRIRLGWFVQDDFRVGPNLTLNLGFRHEFFTSPREVNGWSANLRKVTDPESTVGPPFQTPKANFAPRLGLAWDPTGSGKTSLRLGAGLFHNFIEGRAYYFESGQDAKFFQNVRVTNPPFPLGLSRGVSAQLEDTRSVEFDAATPALVHWNLEIQRELAPTISLRVGYVGSHGYDLPGLSTENIRIAQIQPDGSKFFLSNAPLVNPNFATIEYLRTNYRSNYNALQVFLQKSYSQGLQFQASYTLGKTLTNSDASTSGDTSASGIVALDIQDLDRDYGRAVYDQRHTFVFNSRYKMPWDHLLHGSVAKAVLGGWAISGIFSVGSGLAFNVQTGFNNSLNGDNQNPDRPNLAPGASNDPIHGVTAGCQGIPAGQKLGTPDRFFDPCAFELNPAGTFGNLGRNTVTQPDLTNVDLVLEKDTPISERMHLEFRAEFFNLFNHPFFGLPNRNVFNSSRTRSGNAGRITATFNDNRQIQFGLKLIF